MAVRDLDRAIVALSLAIDRLGYRAASAMYNLACAYALKGEVESGIRYLEKAVDAGFDNNDKLRDDPDISSLRVDSRFQKIRELGRTLSLSQFNSEDSQKSK